MSMRELAERILRSERIEDKLRAPETLADDSWAEPLEEPTVPARPPSLRFDRPASREPFPSGPRDLESDRGRGVALHFFANHELLALELMALVLLRFPKAPRRFRWGVVHTMLEEQDHLRRYVERMEELGVELGDVPVSSFFWRALADMKSPLDFVAGMSLTFEQANIDFAHYFAERFREVGDDRTASVLDRVLADEIRHVAHGRGWLERWAPPAETLFERHRAALPAPLTLRRAKGPTFRTAERRAAGLPERYIEELRVHSDGRGRRPDLWRFNPEADEAAAGRDPPSKASVTVRRDLGSLLGFLAAPDDVVWVDVRPSTSFRAAWADAGLTLPRFVTDPESVPAIEHLRLWAPRAPHPEDGTDAPGSAAAGAGCPAPRRSPAATPAALFSKAWDLEVERRLREASIEGVAAAPEDRACSFHLDDVRARFVAGSDRPLRLKAPFGTAGRGQRTVRTHDDLRALEPWIRRTLDRGHGVIVEPELDLVMELSILLDTDEPRVVRDILETWTADDGRYVGHRFGPPWPRIPRPILAEAGGGRALRDRLETVGRHVAEQARAAGHIGLAGIDARVHRRTDRTLGLQAIGEVNPRCTMGHVASALRRRLAPGRDGAFVIVPRDRLGEAPPAPTFDPKAGSGFLYATDPEAAARLVALASVVAPGKDPFSPLPAEARAWVEARGGTVGRPIS